MISGLKRRLRPAEEQSWDADQALGPEAEEGPDPVMEDAVLETSDPVPGFSPDDGDPVEYYKGIVKTAIENGGRYREHQIPVPWLRMILAGLESRNIDLDKMWFETDWDASSLAPAEVPPYREVFPTEEDRFAGLK